MTEEESRSNDMTNLLKDVMSSTSPEGYPDLHKWAEKVKTDWASICGLIQSKMESLQSVLDQWLAYDSDFEACQNWLCQVDVTLHSIDLKPTLADKQQQLKQLRVRALGVIHLLSLLPASCE